MPKIPRRTDVLLQPRSDQRSSSTMINLLITLLALVFISLLLTTILLVARTIRRRRAFGRHQVPYKVNHAQNHQQLSLGTPYSRSSMFSIYDEKKSPSSSNSPLSTESVPEIRITFPDEQDEAGRRMSGRVVVVRVGEAGIGLEPLRGEQLPAYQENGDQFQSIDMDHIGGLKEKQACQ